MLTETGWALPSAEGDMSWIASQSTAISDEAFDLPELVEANFFFAATPSTYRCLRSAGGRAVRSVVSTRAVFRWFRCRTGRRRAVALESDGRDHFAVGAALTFEKTLR